MNNKVVVFKFKWLIEKIIKQEEKEPLPEYLEIIAALQFTEEECEQMSRDIAYHLLKFDRIVHIIKRVYKDKVIYILRYRRFGFNIEVEDEDLKEAKRKFIEKTFEIPLSGNVKKVFEKVNIQMSA